MKFVTTLIMITRTIVAPFAGAWIEIENPRRLLANMNVAPFAGAWIEILSYLLQLVGIVASLPSRERGLKFIKNTFGIKFDRSLPSRERGLKLKI